jgi:hypothetical protein
LKKEKNDLKNFTRDVSPTKLSIIIKTYLMGPCPMPLEKRKE